MATIDLSAGFMSGLPQRIIRLGEWVSNSGQAPHISGLLPAGAVPNTYDNVSNGELRLMKGTMPIDFAGLSNGVALSTDQLVNFSVAAGHFAPSQTNVNPAVISTIYATAAYSGTATWFWWCDRATYLSNSNAALHNIVGTVGLTGSGADLEMDSIAITAGQPYRVLNLRILFPSTWVY